VTAPADILVVGSVALDSVRTPFGEVVDALGGSASYFSLSATHFAPVRMVAVVGKDFPREHRALFESRRIDLSGLETADGRTFRWRGEYSVELGHAHTLETQLNVFSTFHPRLDDVHRTAAFVFLANIDPDLQLEVRRQMRSPRLTVSDTMNYWIARKPDRVLDVLREVDVALLNEEEARALSGETQLVRAADRLLAQGAKAVIIKKGEHGALYQSADERFITPAFPVEGLSDPTGAGDSFAGGSPAGSPAAAGSTARRCARRWRAARRWRRSRSRTSARAGSSRRCPPTSPGGSRRCTGWWTSDWRRRSRDRRRAPGKT
jgi:sugar/nucleoside kinase (ribokinase family)